VRRRAIEGLGRLRVVDGAPDLRAFFQKAPESEEGILAFNSLAEIALVQDRPLFQRLAGQSETRKRRSSIEALARLVDKGNEARFKRAFQREKDDELRAAYAFALFLFGDRPFIDTVILGLAGSKDRARQSRGYVEELGARSLPEALDYLRELDPRIRAGLCDALSTAGVSEATPAIEPLIRDQDTQVAKSASRALAILKRPR
jgi:HEAT repeat protein